MRFWLVAAIESVPIRLIALFVRILGWLVVLSAVVIWWGPGDTDPDPTRALAGLVVGAAVWAIGMAPRRLIAEAATAADR